MPLDQPWDGPDGDMPMPLGDHLEALRRRVLYALAGVVAGLFVSLPLGFHLVGWLAQPLLQAQVALGYPPQTQVTDPTAGFASVYLPVVLISAVILACPWVLYQFWRFVVIGLYAHERKAVYLLTPFSTFMTALGVLFARYVMLPVSLLFFLNFSTLFPEIEVGRPDAVTSLLLKAYGIDDLPDVGIDEAGVTTITPPVLPVLPAPPAPELRQEGMVWIDGQTNWLSVARGEEVWHFAPFSNRLVTPIPRLNEYVRFAAFMTLGVVVAFQLPVVMLVAGWTGLFDPAILSRSRKYAVLMSVVLGAVLTPTDIFSMLVLAVPLYGLFEVGLLLMRWADARRPRVEPGEVTLDDVLP